MSTQAGSYARLEPSMVMPELIINYNQRSGAFRTLSDKGLQARLSEGDQAVYIKVMDVHTRNSAGQSAYNQLPNASITMRQISTPTYLIRTHAEYDRHDTASAGRWGVALPEAQRMAMRQGIFQQSRSALLYGFSPSNGEGLLNTPGATTASLPADSLGNTTVATYDNAQLGIYFLFLIQQLLQRMYQTGQGGRVTVLGPQEILGPMELQNIVQLTSYQRVGAGTDSTAGLIKSVSSLSNIEIDWNYDDTLIGKGAGGADAVIITMPELPKQDGEGEINTNEFGEFMPSMTDLNLMFSDVAAPIEIPSPLPFGATDVLMEMRITSGWGTRGEAVTILSIRP